MITSKRSIVLTTRKIKEIETKKYIGIYINEKNNLESQKAVHYCSICYCITFWSCMFFVFFLTGVGVTVMSGMTANNF